MKKSKKYIISLFSSLLVLFSLTTPILYTTSAEGVLAAIGLVDTVEEALKYTILIGNALETENPLEEALLTSGHFSNPLIFLIRDRAESQRRDNLVITFICITFL